MHDENNCLNWKHVFKKFIPLEFHIGIQAGSYAALSFVRSLICCMRKFEDQESVVVFRPTDEKPPCEIANSTVTDNSCNNNNYDENNNVSVSMTVQSYAHD